MITVATPMYGGMCTAHYTNSLINNILYLNRNQIKVDWNFVSQESLIPRARNELVRQFLNTSNQYLVFIDADINFPQDSIYKLVNHDKDVVVGLYPKRKLYWDKIKEAALAGIEDIWNFGCSFVLNSNHNNFSSTLVEIDHGGTGFMCIKRQVFEKLIPFVETYKQNDYDNHITYNFFNTSIDEGLYLSEDYHFCQTWLKNGGKIFADTTIKLDHIGSFVFSGDLKRAGKNTT